MRLFLLLLTITVAHGQIGTLTSISEFIREQLNAIIQTSIIGDISFRVCDRCPLSILNNIQLGNEARSSDSGCEGARLPGIGCVGCSWAYEVGVDSINGLGTLTLPPNGFTIGQPVINTVAGTNIVHVPLTIVAEATSTSIYVTAQLQPCIAGTTFGPRNSEVEIAGRPTVTINLNLVGVASETYDGMTLAAFDPHRTEVTSVKLSVTLPNNWIRVPRELDFLVSTLVYPLTFAIRTTLNIIAIKVTPIIDGVIRNLVAKLPSVNIYVVF